MYLAVLYRCVGMSTHCIHGECYNTTEGELRCHCDNVYTGDRCDKSKYEIEICINCN